MRLLLVRLLLIPIAFSTNANALEFSTVEQNGTKFTVCKVDVAKEHLQLFHCDASGHPFKHLDKLAHSIESTGHRLLFAMNAGMYHSNFNAVGLFVADGKQVTELNNDEGIGNFFLKPNGVFMVSGKGARVIDASQYPSVKGAVKLATQSGPLLVKNGGIHPAFKPDSDSKHIRNGVGVLSSGAAVFVISEEAVNFYEFALLFKETLHCPNALYFDGSVSSLYAPQLGRNDSRRSLGPIIGVTD